MIRLIFSFLLPITILFCLYLIQVYVLLVPAIVFILVLGSLTYVTWTKERMEHNYPVSELEQKILTKITTYIGEVK